MPRTLLFEKLFLWVFLARPMFLSFPPTKVQIVFLSFIKLSQAAKVRDVKFWGRTERTLFLFLPPAPPPLPLPSRPSLLLFVRLLILRLSSVTLRFYLSSRTCWFETFIICALCVPSLVKASRFGASMVLGGLEWGIPERSVWKESLEKRKRIL